MNYRLIFSVNEEQKEFAQQEIRDDGIKIFINNQYRDYSEFERFVMLLASTSTLALLRDTNFKQNEIPNMFFKFVNAYDDGSMPGITNAEWFKTRNITVTDNGIIIDNE
jgi:hypothetical protein